MTIDKIPMTAAGYAALEAELKERQQVERRDADHRDAQRQRQRLAGGQPDPHPGEQTGPDVDGHQAELVEPDVGLGEDEVDRRREDLGVAPAPSDLEQGGHALVAAEGHAHLLGGRLDAEDQHDVPRAFTPGASALVVGELFKVIESKIMMIQAVMANIPTTAWN